MNRAGWALWAFASCAPLIACKDRPEGADAAPAVASSLAASPMPPAPSATASTDAGESLAMALPTTLDPSRFPLGGVVAAKPIGHTSIVFKLDFDTGGRAAFKPESKRGKGRWRGEVAAYRLGVALGLPHVPPAFAVAIEKATLERAARAKGAGELFDEEVVARGPKVHGALIPWIDKLETWPFESSEWRARWQPALRASTDLSKVESETRRLLPAIASMIAFDYVTGNWDRWSGANVGRSGDRVLFIDNDGAFFDPAPKEPLAKQKALLLGVERFSRSLYDALERIDDAWLERTFDKAPDGSPLVSTDVRRALVLRAKGVREAIDGAIARHGRDTVLAFP